MDATPFTALDRKLLKGCLNRAPGSWNDFVDRYLSLIYHVIGYTAHVRSVRLRPEETEDVAAEVLLKIVSKDFKVLREFRGTASLATYLTVIARRICVAELARRAKARKTGSGGEIRLPEPESDDPAAHQWLESQEEVEKLLRRLSGKDREIVRLYWLEGRTYEEISAEVDMPVNSIGSILSRARAKLREMAAPASSTMEMRSLKRMVEAEAPRIRKKPTKPN